jgi:hypothetical protein
MVFYDIFSSFQYLKDNNIKTLVRHAAVLPLVSVNEVEDMWFHALENNDYDTPEVTRFADYVTEQWVESWNHYDNDRPRTTNNVEGWHSKINKTCKTTHPNIYTMVKMLQNIQSTNEAKLIQLSEGGKQ